jgi:UDP-3-O-[3-hydroxymyristoyl] glucosamine N-acyltransferase
MKFTLAQVAQIINATVEGDATVAVDRLDKIEDAQEGALSFLANPKYEKFIYETKATGVIVSNNFKPRSPVTASLLKVEDPYAAFAQLLDFYNREMTRVNHREMPQYIDESAEIGKGTNIGAFAYIAKGVKIGKNCVIHPHVYIGSGAIIGDDCILNSGVRIGHLCRLGNKCTLHFGVVIGSDGFGFAPAGESYQKVAQIGDVVIGNGVEIGANTTIDRATLGSTKIGNGVKLDNLIQIGHNVEIGENTVIAAQSGIAGSTKVGRNCMIGGQVGISGHLTIGDNVKIAAQSGIGKSVKDREIIMGSPAIPASDFQRAYVIFKQLPTFAKKINEIK